MSETCLVGEAQGGLQLELPSQLFSLIKRYTFSVTLPHCPLSLVEQQHHSSLCGSLGFGKTEWGLPYSLHSDQFPSIWMMRICLARAVPSPPPPPPPPIIAAAASAWVTLGLFQFPAARGSAVGPVAPPTPTRRTGGTRELPFLESPASLVAPDFQQKARNRRRNCWLHLGPRSGVSEAPRRSQEKQQEKQRPMRHTLSGVK